MIPVSLKLKGIYSYREEQFIDFTKLTQGQIFGIFGAVGSGKSTILEAVSFALYNDTERLNKSGDNRYYNMMNLRSQELEIDFIFRMKGEEYRVLVQGKRMKNRDAVNKFDRHIYRREGEEWQPTAAEPGGIIGLSYENFRRTVIIPQGQFEEFLRLGKTERTRMMKDIFGLGKYDLAGKVKRLETENKEKSDVLTGRLQQFAEVTAESLREATTALKTQTQSFKTAEKEVKKMQKALATAEKLQDLFARAAAAREAFEHTAARAEEFALFEQKIKQTKDCLLRFKPLLDRRADLERQARKNAEKRREKEHQEENLRADLKKKSEKFAEVKQLQEEKPRRTEKVNDLRNLAKIRTLTDRTARGEEILRRQKEKIARAEADLKTKKAEYLSLKKQIKQAESDLPDDSELSDLKVWFSERKSLRAAVAEARKAHVAAQKEYAAVTTEFRTVLAESGCPITAKRMGGAVKELETAKAAAEENLRKAEEEKAHLRVKSRLEKYAADLTPGAPCPICGATEHPDVLDSVAASTAMTRTEARLQAAKAEIDNLNGCILKAREIIAKGEERNRSVIAKNEEIKAKEARSDAHLAAFPGKNYGTDDEEKVNAAAAAATEARKKLKSLRDRADELDQAEEKEEQQLKKYEAEAAELQKESAAAEGEKDALLAQLKVLSAEENTELSAADLTARAGEEERHIAENEARFKTLQSEINTLTAQQNSLTGQLSVIRKQASELQSDLSAAVAGLETAIADSDYADAATVTGILSENLDLEQAEADLKAYRTAYLTAQQNHKRLQAETKGQEFDNQTFIAQKAQTEQAEAELREQSEALGRQKQIAADLEKKTAQKAELEKDAAAVRKRGENIDILKKLFKAEGFVSYISSVYLQNLCEAANRRFYHLTKQQLRLELNADNSFDVRDYLNDGKLRSVKTLSGGQTFQASLSLALALAESVQKQNETDRNFFFLDEGFGTQDEESLQAVFAALKSLRKENRIVGVISHVKGLQQEIDVNLLIEKDEERGSVIRASWE